MVNLVKAVEYFPRSRTRETNTVVFHLKADVSVVGVSAQRNTFLIAGILIGVFQKIIEDGNQGVRIPDDLRKIWRDVYCQPVFLSIKALSNGIVSAVRDLADFHLIELECLFVTFDAGEG